MLFQISPNISKHNVPLQKETLICWLEFHNIYRFNVTGFYSNFVIFFYNLKKCHNICNSTNSEILIAIYAEILIPKCIYNKYNYTEAAEYK